MGVGKGSTLEEIPKRNNKWETQRIELLYKITKCLSLKSKKKQKTKNKPWDFPGGPVVKTLCFHCRESRVWSLACQGIKIPHAKRWGQKKKEKDTSLGNQKQDILKWKDSIYKSGPWPLELQVSSLVYNSVPRPLELQTSQGALSALGPCWGLAWGASQGCGAERSVT